MSIAKLTQEQTEKTKDTAHTIAGKITSYIGRKLMGREEMATEDIELIIYNDIAMLIHSTSEAELEQTKAENKRLREACLLAIEQRDHEHKTAKRLRDLLQQTKEYVGGRNCTRVLTEEIIAATDGGE